MRAGRYLLIAGIVSAGLAAAIAVFNWSVDPFGFFKRNTFGFYHVNEEKLFKARMVGLTPYDAVILGSSKTGIIETGVTERWGLKSFNASMVGGYPEEMLYFFRNFADGVPLFFVGFDFYMFDDACYGYRHADFGILSAKNVTTYLLSFGSTRSSIVTIRDHLKGKPVVYLTSGTRNMTAQEAANAAATTRDYRTILADLDRIYDCTYRPSPRRLDAARRLIAEIARSGRTAIPFLNPVNPAILERLEARGERPAFDAWRRTMAREFPGIVDLTVSPLAVRRNFYWNDPVHYTQATGARIIELLMERRGAPPTARP